MTRKTGSFTDYNAQCGECDWHASTRNALGLAAQHHDRTGHFVRIEMYRVVFYGEHEGREK